jgi:hypothetical protein
MKKRLAKFRFRHLTVLMVLMVLMVCGVCGITLLSGCGGSAGGGFLGLPLTPAAGRSTEKPVIPAQGVYLGAILLSGQTTLSGFNQATGIRHAAFADFFRFPETVQPGHAEKTRMTAFLQECSQNGALAMVTLETFGGLDSFVATDLDLLARALSQSSVSILLRWNHEMNGSWYPWGQQPTKYIQRFREVATVMREKTQNVAMTWTPNQGWGYPWANGAYSIATSAADFALLDTDKNNLLNESDDPYLPYYPGDEYVDWVGHSFYHWSNQAERGFNQVPNLEKWGQANGVSNAIPNFHQIFAVGRQKPMVIAETSAFFDLVDTKEGGAPEAEIKKNWIRQVYNTQDSSIPRLDTQFPMLKAIFWFNQLKYEAETGSQVDWRLSTQPEVRAFYTETVQKSYFLKAPDVITASE